MTAVLTAVVVAVASVGVLVAIGVANFQNTQTNAEEARDVLGTVEIGAVQQELTVAVQTTPTASSAVASDRLGGGVVTGAAPSQGSVLDDGGVLMNVDEKPVVVIVGKIPAYRNLSQGVEGEDVRQLQDYLHRQGFTIWDESGVFGPSTSYALYEHFQARKFEPTTADGARAGKPNDVGLPLSRYIFVPQAPVIVGENCGVSGQAVSETRCVLQSQQVTVTISDDSGQDLSGLPVRLRTASGDDVAAVVGGPLSAPPEEPEEGSSQTAAPEEGEGQGTDGSDTEKRYAVTTADAELPAELADSGRVVVESSPDDGFRIPATAIREKAGGEKYVREPGPAEKASSEPVDHPVEILLCTDGYCAVQGDDIAEGMKVVLLG